MCPTRPINPSDPKSSTLILTNFPQSLAWDLIQRLVVHSDGRHLCCCTSRCEPRGSGQGIAESRCIYAFKHFQFPPFPCDGIRIVSYLCLLVLLSFRWGFGKRPRSATKGVNMHTSHLHWANNDWARQLRSTAQRARGHAADDHSSLATDFHDLRRCKEDSCSLVGLYMAVQKAGPC